MLISRNDAWITQRKSSMKFPLHAHSDILCIYVYTRYGPTLVRCIDTHTIAACMILQGIGCHGQILNLSMDLSTYIYYMYIMYTYICIDIYIYIAVYTAYQA